MALAFPVIRSTDHKTKARAPTPLQNVSDASTKALRLEGVTYWASTLVTFVDSVFAAALRLNMTKCL